MLNPILRQFGTGPGALRACQRDARSRGTAHPAESKSNKRIALLLASLTLALFVAPAVAFPIGGTHTKDEIRAKCATSGGEFSANLETFSCFVKNCDGKGGNCSVSCGVSDGKCDGSVPPSRISTTPKGGKFDLNNILTKQAN